MATRPSYSAAKNKSSKPHFMYWTAQLHNAILLRKSAEIKKMIWPMFMLVKNLPSHKKSGP